MFKVCVVCSDQRVLEDLSRMASPTGDVTILPPFTSIPTEVVLDRYLRIRAPHAILISGSGGSLTTGFIEHIRRTYPNLQVGMLCADRDPEALVSFMRAGVRETIFLPFDENEVKAALARLRAQAAGKEAIPRTGEVLCFLPSKPGVGASTVAVNTAAALSRKKDSKVLLVDADLSSGMVRFMLQIKNQLSILDAARRVADLDEAFWPQLVTTLPGGLDVVHAGKMSTSFSFQPHALLSLLDFWRRTYDVICIDLPGNLEQFSLELMHQATKIFLVSTSELAALHLLTEKVQLLNARSIVDQVYVIHNRKSPGDDLSREHIEEITGLPVIRAFRNSYSETTLASKEGRAVRPDSALGTEFSDFAAHLRGEPVPNRKRSTLRSLLSGRSGQSTPSPSPA